MNIVGKQGPGGPPGPRPGPAGPTGPRQTLVILNAMVPYLPSDTVTVTGKLTDAVTSQPIHLGIVEVTGSAYIGQVGAPVNDDGTYSFQFTAPSHPGPYIMQAHFYGAIGTGTNISSSYIPSNSGIQTLLIRGCAGFNNTDCY
jgi:hypothetical protein